MGSAISAMFALVSGDALAQEPAPDPLPPPEVTPPPPVIPRDPEPAPEVTVSPNPLPRPPPEPPKEPSGRDNVAAYYTGFHIGIAPGFLFPVNGGSAGFVLSGVLGYGVDTDSVIVVPEVPTSFIFSDAFVWTLTPGAKLVVPIGWFAPYLGAGAGPGYVGGDVKKWGAALRGTVGFTLHPTRRFAIGLGGQYERITGTEFQSLGPIITLSF
jgi:hypothetical protein